MYEYMREYGRQLIQNGYQIVPLKPGSKHPTLTEWTKIDADEETWDAWMRGPMANWGIGILTKHTPAIDIDVDDPETVRALYLAIREIIGPCTAYRIGRAPRVLILCRTEEPFTKLRSSKYVDPSGKTHQIEILGQGQQFAAYHVHPDTGRPYQWPHGNPLDTPVQDLPFVSKEIACKIIDAFEKIADALSDWTKETRGSIGVRSDNLLSAPHVSSIGDADIAGALEVISSGDHDQWIKVGMALHHQFGGSSDGWVMWDQWSQTNGGGYPGADETHRRWSSFTDARGESTATIATIFWLRDEALKQQSKERTKNVESSINACVDYDDLLGGETAKQIRGYLDGYPLRVDAIHGLVKKRATELCGSAVSIATIRRALSPTRTSGSSAVNLIEGPAGLEFTKRFVYVTEDDRFFQLDTKHSMSRSGFDATHNRVLLATRDSDKDGKLSAAQTVLDYGMVDVVQGVRFLPGFAERFRLGNSEFVNRYDPNAGAVMPEAYSEADIAALQHFGVHCKTLIPDERNRNLFMDFLAHCVQFPGKKINWTILLQGQEGDGKTFFANLMGLMLGQQNVGATKPKALASGFNGWAESKVINFIEEIYMPGQNGYEVLETIKTYITNPTISIRRMRTDEYDAPNVTNYVMFTNHQNAVPLKAGDTRFYVIFSAWKTQEDLAAWNARNPEFFETLYRVAREHTGAFRKWFTERKLSAAFDPNRRAPAGGDKARMTQLTRDDTEVYISELIEDKGGELGKNEVLLSTTWLLEVWGTNGDTLERPNGKKLNSVLLRCGWQLLEWSSPAIDGKSDRVKIGGRDGLPHRFWSRNLAGLTELGCNYSTPWLRENLSKTFNKGQFSDSGFG